MDTWTFTVMGEPVAKERPRLGRGGTRTPKKTVDYEKLVGGAAMEARVLIGEGQCDIVIAVWLRPSKVSMKKRDRPGLRFPKDPDNVAKAVVDGILRAGTGCLANDTFDHIRNLHVVRGGYSVNRARIEVTVTRVESDIINGSEQPEIQPFFGAVSPELFEIFESAARDAGYHVAPGGRWVN